MVQAVAWPPVLCRPAGQPGQLLVMDAPLTKQPPNTVSDGHAGHAEHEPAAAPWHPTKTLVEEHVWHATQLPAPTR